MKRGNGEILGDAVRMAIATIGPIRGSVTVKSLSMEPWASVTFSGARHRLLVTFDGSGAVGAAADLLDRLNDLDVMLPGQFLADLALVAEARRDDGRHASLELEALIIEE